MHWILHFLVTHRTIGSLIFTVSLSLLMITAGRQQQENIARTLALTVFSPVQFTLGWFYQLHDVFEENDILRAKVEAAQIENTMLRGLLSDVADEVADIDLSTVEYDVVAARIISREPTFFFNTAIIDIGHNHGVVRNMPVISSGGIIAGRIISVLPFTSQVQFIHAPEERASIEHVRTGSVGILESAPNGNLFADFRSTSTVAVGDTVHTTGLGGIYPRGFKVGTVELIAVPRDGDVFKQVYIKSGINFDRLRNVFVVKSMPRWGGPREELSGDYEEEGGE